MLWANFEVLRTSELERVEKHIVVPVLDAEQRRTLATMKRSLLQLNVKALPAPEGDPDNHFAGKTDYQDHVMLELALYPMHFRPDTDKDGRDWSIRVGIIP